MITLAIGYCLHAQEEHRHQEEHATATSFLKQGAINEQTKTSTNPCHCEPLFVIARSENDEAISKGGTNV